MKRSVWMAVVCLTAFLQDSPHEGSSKWLVIAASKSEVVQLIEVTRDLRISWPAATIVASSDCKSLHPGLYLAVVEIAPTRSEADGVVKKLRTAIPDAYVRECSPKPNTTLALGVPLIDPSIADVPASVVDWSDSDRISSVQRLPEHGYLWLRRRYERDPEDPLEGRRVSVIYFQQKAQNGVELESNCIYPEDTQHGQLIALTCAREVAGDQLFHETLVFETPSGKKIKSVPHCRKGVFDSGNYLTCQEEYVGAQSKLTLVPKRVALD